MGDNLLSWSVPCVVSILLVIANYISKHNMSIRREVEALEHKLLSMSDDLKRLRRFVLGAEEEDGYPAQLGLANRLSAVEAGVGEINKKQQQVLITLARIDSNTGGPGRAGEVKN